MCAKFYVVHFDNSSHENAVNKWSFLRKQVQSARHEVTEPLPAWLPRPIHTPLGPPEQCMAIILAQSWTRHVLVTVTVTVTTVVTDPQGLAGKAVAYEC